MPAACWLLALTPTEAAVLEARSSAAFVVSVSMPTAKAAPSPASSLVLPEALSANEPV